MIRLLKRIEQMNEKLIARLDDAIKCLNTLIELQTEHRTWHQGDGR